MNKKIFFLLLATVITAATSLFSSCNSCSSSEYNEKKEHAKFEMDYGSMVKDTYSLLVESPDTLPYDGGTRTFAVTSYKIKNNGNKIAVPWVLEFSYDGGISWTIKREKWLSDVVTEGFGGTDYDTCSVAALPQSTEIERVADYDLSTEGGKKPRTTANCYIVNKPGTYKLPLVYGNAIKNDEDNAIAYKPTGENGGAFLTPFINHLGKPITSPWIKDNGIRPDKADIIWQDGKFIITKVSLDGDYLRFNVDDNAPTGNAVIAVTSNGKVCWSWHIWATTERYDKTITVRTGSRMYRIAPANLGWCYNGQQLNNNGSERKVLARIRQTEKEGLTEKIAFCQQGKKLTADSYGFCTYYQWGRKDPEIPAEGYNPRTAYNSQGHHVQNFFATAKGMMATILYPAVHFSDDKSGNPGPYGSSQYNVWNAVNDGKQQEGAKTVKTIFDPCPPGFCVPNREIMTFLTKEGTMNWQVERGGYEWKKDENILFFPCTGKREERKSGIEEVGKIAMLWTADAETDLEGYLLQMQDGEAKIAKGHKAAGYCIRPVADE